MQLQQTEAPQTLCQFCGTSLPPRTWFCTNCGAPAISSPQTATGPRLPVLPGYTVVGTLGSGGSAVVYRARQLNLDREVAVKLIRHEVDDGSAWRRFEREAKIIASLTGHPHVVTIYDVGRTPAGQPFLVTELLDRGSLTDVIATDGPLTATRAVAVGQAMASALSAAHARGILHRDLKPANLLLNSLGQIKLADFGIARLMAGHAHTTTGTLAFTPEHAAPEVLRGDTEGTATDVYGLASTVATALAGHSLFTLRPDERIEALMYRKLMEPPPPLPSSVPPALATLVDRCLAADPTARPSLEEVSAELDRLAVAPAAVASPAAPAALSAPAASRAAATVSPSDDPLGVRDARPSRDGRWLAAIVFAVALIVGAVALMRGDGDVQLADATTTEVAVLPAPVPPQSDPAASAIDTAVPTAPQPSAPATEAPAAAPATEAPAAPATAAPVLTVPATAAPVLETVPATPAPEQAPAPVESGIGIDEDEALAFVRGYYEQIRAGQLDQTWPRLTPDFRSGRNLTFERYANYWRTTSIEIEDLRFTAGPGADEARVRFDARYSTGGEVIDEVDEVTLRREPNGEIVITEQRRVD